MWTTENRCRYDRDHLRYPSDLTDDEWALIQPHIPPAKHGGRRREVDERAVLNGILYVLSTGCQWRAIPKDLPPRSTVHDYLDRWQWDGTLDRVHHALYVQCREQAGRAWAMKQTKARRRRSSTARASRARKKMLWGGRRGLGTIGAGKQPMECSDV